MIRAQKATANAYPENSTTRRVLQAVEFSDDEATAGPEHGELWLVSYADLMTLLFGFFVMMYADSGRIEEVKKTFEPLTEIESSVLKERIADLEAKLKDTKTELLAAQKQAEPLPVLKQSSPESQRLLFKMPCRFCANFSSILDSAVAGHLMAAPTDIVITHVTRGGPADLAGIRAGDLIESVDGRAPNERGLFESFAVGQEVAVSLRRFGQKIVITVRLDSISPEALKELSLAPIEKSLPIGEVSVSRIGPRERITHYIPSEIEGALVTVSCENCGYLREHLQVGDVIVSVNGEWVHSPEQLARIWNAPAVVEVWRKGSRSYDLVRLAPGAGPA